MGAVHRKVGPRADGGGADPERAVDLRLPGQPPLVRRRWRHAWSCQRHLHCRAHRRWPSAAIRPAPPP